MGAFLRGVTGGGGEEAPPKDAARVEDVIEDCTGDGRGMSENEGHAPPGLGWEAASSTAGRNCPCSGDVGVGAASSSGAETESSTGNILSASTTVGKYWLKSVGGGGVNGGGAGSAGDGCAGAVGEVGVGAADETGAVGETGVGDIGASEPARGRWGRGGTASPASIRTTLVLPFFKLT
jgi:hypothetical protein